MVANGDRVACRGLARDVGLRITQQGVGHEDFTLDCFTIPLDCHDSARHSFPPYLGADIVGF